MAVVVTGGWGHDTAEVYDVVTDKWKLINTLPSKVSYHSAAAIAGMVYIAGGQDEKKAHVNSLLRYYPHPKHPSWVECAPLKKSRYAFGLVAAEQKLFAVGGFTDQGSRKIVEDHADSTVECYAPGANMWSLGPKLPMAVSGVATASLGGCIYTVSDADACKYDVGTRRWETIPPPHVKSRHLALAACAGALYAIGGYSMADDEALARVERYDPGTNKWTVVAALPAARHSIACAVVGSRIFCCGGTTSTKEAVSEVVAYDSEDDAWYMCAPMLRGRGGAAAVGIPVNNL